ncbi:hypothetical protein AMTR_s00166p00067930 [Amborella trichopoda]|uniref:Myb/SANT-like domain-containing protein n=1 Tax=Amborella trichopoda TaxID=13333 RepID=W1PS51_AMBTC|nr:hypothetical protein AMTR_s00166p00067930 [Amborella trichopoda]
MANVSVNLSNSEEKGIFKWNPEHDKYLLESMVNMGATDLRKKDWIEICSMMNEEYGHVFHKDKLKNKVKCLKFKYRRVRDLLLKPGFHFDAVSRRIGGSGRDKLMKMKGSGSTLIYLLWSTWIEFSGIGIMPAMEYFILNNMIVFL